MLNRKPIFKNVKNVILTSPANAVSGGPELLHQLCHTLRSFGMDAYMTYYNEGGITQNIPIPSAYEKYDVILLSDFSLLQEESTLLVIGEMAVPLYFHFPQCQKCIWWLSVDNYLSSYSQEIEASTSKHPDVFQLRNDSSLIHLAQSEYAIHFLLNKMELPLERIAYLSDYLNSEFFSVKIPSHFKQNFIAFNPKKGFKILKPLIDATPHFTWMPIINMAAKDVANLLRLSKVYIDFGNHPGKDRIPREAAISGCCVITNTEGSAAFYEDVPIPDSYKFEDPAKSQEEIIALIQDIFSNYENHYEDFAYYCQRIIGEEEKFTADAKELFSNALPNSSI